MFWIFPLKWIKRSISKIFSKIVVGHFTQIVWGNSDAVGCAISLFNGNTAFVICNFAQGNLMGTPVYEAGTTASKCETGTNPKYPGLCSESEQFSGQPTIPGFDNSAPAGSNGGGAGSPMVIPANCDEACIRDILVQNGFSPDTEFTVVGWFYAQLMHIYTVKIGSKYSNCTNWEVKFIT